MSNKNIRQIITNNLNELLSRGNIKAVDFAEAVGVSKSAVSHWLSGDNSPNLVTSTIAALFGAALFFVLNAEKWLKIWTNLCFIPIRNRRKQYQTVSTKINKSTQNLHSKNCPSGNHKPEGLKLYIFIKKITSHCLRECLRVC